jgi:N-methylhydantoinase A
MDILGVDIGGTFTDFVLLRGDRLLIHKLLSTPDDPARALLAGVAVLGAPTALVHGTTVATNALLERRGAPTALITTAGFRDVLAIGRGDRPALYDIDVTRPEPLVPDSWRLELAERMDHTGAIIRPLDAADLNQIVAWLAASPIVAVAVCLLHAYANPAHEQLIVEALDRVVGTNGAARFVVSASHQVLPEQREYERTSTTVVNAYVAPVLRRYLGELGAALAQQGVRSLRIMASDGGSMGLATARELPARATLSGPAGGVVGARYIAGRAGHTQIITFDMGGTSTDVALCNGALPQTGESRVGGLPVRLPSLDIHTVGAGGGSLARIDAGGALRVGPASAGADPGPACYGKGTQPTVTDANLLLGRLRADYFLGGRMALDHERARAAITLIATALGTPPGAPADDDALLRSALGVVRVANAAMERAIRTISIERGDDPRDFTLVAFGGAGPLHAAHLAEALDMRRVLVPRYPGVLSALGMLAADVTRDASQALLRPLAELDSGDLGRRMADLASAGLAALAADDEPTDRCRIEFALDLRYRGQSYEISTPLLQWGAIAAEQRMPLSDDLEAAAGRFHALHERRYGHAMPERAVEAVTLRMKAIGARPALAYDATGDLPARAGPLTPHATISAALENDTATLVPAQLYQRDDMRPGDTFDGPAVVVQLDATTVIPAGWRATVDQDLQLLLTAER